MAQGVMTGRTPEVMQQILDSQMNRCREELKKADHFGKLGDIESARRRFDRVRAMVKDSRFPAEYLNELKESIRQIEVTGLREIELSDLTPEMARRQGFAGLVDLLKIAKHGPGERVFLVEFEYLAA